MNGVISNNQLHGAEVSRGIKYYGLGAWKKAVVKNYGLQCALCHRALKIDEKIVKVAFRADRGVYLQMYHEKCAAVRQSVGERPEFASGRETVAWAELNGCRGCDKLCNGCHTLPFDCDRCMDTLRILGEGDWGAEPDAETEDEDEEY